MSAKVILIAASKGGPGKTTLAAALAAYAVSLGENVILVDADPQLSLGMWHERRGWPTNPAYTSAIEDRDLGRTIEQARNWRRLGDRGFARFAHAHGRCHCARRPRGHPRAPIDARHRSGQSDLRTGG